MTAVLIDEAALLAYRALCGTEDTPYPGTGLAHLERGERSPFERLQRDPALRGLRLEQERLPWLAVMAALHGLLGL